LVQKPFGRLHVVVSGYQIQNVHGVAALAAIFIPGPVGCAAFAADSSQGCAALATEGCFFLIIAGTVGAEMAPQNESTAASITGDVTAVLANINRIEAVGTGNFCQNFVGHH
jgi:hypothetical protein